MTVGLIWAEAADGLIGDRGELPWHLPEDLARFRALTMGSTVVMGRATWESLPERFRPLPGRRNVVLTRRPDWHAEGASMSGSVEQALAEAAGDVWVIGGASIYAQALPFADRVEITEVDGRFEGDVFAPRLGAEWRRVALEPAEGWLESRTGLRYRTAAYVRDRPPDG